MPEGDRYRGVIRLPDGRLQAVTGELASSQQATNDRGTGIFPVPGIRSLVLEVRPPPPAGSQLHSVEIGNYLVGGEGFGNDY